MDGLGDAYPIAPPPNPLEINPGGVATHRPAEGTISSQAHHHASRTEWGTSRSGGGRPGNRARPSSFSGRRGAARRRRGGLSAVSEVGPRWLSFSGFTCAWTACTAPSGDLGRSARSRSDPSPSNVISPGRPFTRDRPRRSRPASRALPPAGCARACRCASRPYTGRETAFALPPPSPCSHDLRARASALARPGPRPAIAREALNQRVAAGRRAPRTGAVAR